MSEQVVNPNKALWEKGDFTRIAETHAGERSGPGRRARDRRRLAGARPRLRRRDHRAPAARLGAEVLGIDIAPNLVAAGQRARGRRGAGDNLRFAEGDASDLSGLPDDSFDLVLTIFGAMFAPRPFDVAREMVRVAKPGGRIVMGNWIPGDPTLVAQLLKISGAYSPPPPEGFVSPVTWGVENDVLERFAGAGIDPARVSLDRRGGPSPTPARRRSCSPISATPTGRR